MILPDDTIVTIAHLGLSMKQKSCCQVSEIFPVAKCDLNLTSENFLMDTRDIERFLHQDRICRMMFQGVFSCDTLPRNPHLLVCNTDPSYEPGQQYE
jgi:hypothetical protein